MKTRASHIVVGTSYTGTRNSSYLISYCLYLYSRDARVAKGTHAIYVIRFKDIESIISMEKKERCDREPSHSVSCSLSMLATLPSGATTLPLPSFGQKKEVTSSS